MKLVLPVGEHVYVCGQTGSGKTTLVERLISPAPYVLVIDTKHQLAWNGFAITSRTRPIFERPGRYIFRAPSWWGRPHWSAFFEAILDAGNWLVYVDEGHDFVIGASSLTPGLNKLLTKSRSFKETVWFGSQRVKWIPTFVRTETQHCFSFRLKRWDDRVELARDITAGPRDPMYERVLHNPKDRHGFFYHNQNEGTCVECSPLQL